MGQTSFLSTNFLFTEKNRKHPRTKMAQRQTYPLLQKCDMPEEMRVETQELCVTAAEKFATNNESAAKFVREQMDKKFGTGWHVVIGESFDPCVTFDEKSILYMFVGGTTAILVWKFS